MQVLCIARPEMSFYDIWELECVYLLGLKYYVLYIFLLIRVFSVIRTKSLDSDLEHLGSIWFVSQY